MSVFWGDFWAALAGAVGAGTIATLLINLFPSILGKAADSLARRQLERFKVKLETKTYVSKAKFDLSIEMYQRIVSSCAKVKEELSTFFSIYNALQFRLLDEERDVNFYETLYKKVESSICQANTELYPCGILVKQEIADLASKVIYNAKDLSCFIKDIVYKYNCDLNNEKCAEIMLKSSKYYDYINRGFSDLQKAIRDEIAMIECE